MRKQAAIWATRITLLLGATGTIVAACYNDVPGPSGPLPPTREVTPLAPRPGPLMPAPISADTDSGVPLPTIEPGSGTTRVIQTNTRFAPTHEVRDAGVADVIVLPPVPDADLPIDER